VDEKRNWRSDGSGESPRKVGLPGREQLRQLSRAVTNEAGEYEVHGLPPGTYTLVAEPMPVKSPTPRAATKWLPESHSWSQRITRSREATVILEWPRGIHPERSNDCVHSPRTGNTFETNCGSLAATFVAALGVGDFTGIGSATQGVRAWRETMNLVFAGLVCYGS